MHSTALSPHELLYLESHCGSRWVPNGVAHGGSEFRLRQVILECFEHFFTCPATFSPPSVGVPRHMPPPWEGGRGVGHLISASFRATEESCGASKRNVRGVNDVHSTALSPHELLYLESHCGSRWVPNGVAHGGSEFCLRQGNWNSPPTTAFGGASPRRG